MSGESEEDKGDKEGNKEVHRKEVTPVTKFDWDSKWLKGDEYYHILTHADQYINHYNFAKYPPKTHPLATYNEPKSILVVRDRWRYVLCGRTFCWF